MLVVVFFFWHAAAIAVSSIPRASNAPVPRLLRRTLLPIATPYLIATSQWQQWNLFSPDPMRAVPLYTLQAKRDGDWVTILPLTHETLSPNRSPREFKILRSLTAAPDRYRIELSRYLQAFCEPLRLTPGTAMRLAIQEYVNPEGMRTLHPVPLDAETECPPTGSVAAISLPRP